MVLTLALDVEASVAWGGLLTHFHHLVVVLRCADVPVGAADRHESADAEPSVAFIEEKSHHVAFSAYPCQTVFIRHLLRRANIHVREFQSTKLGLISNINSPICVQCLIDYNKWCVFHVRFLKEVYLQVEGWLVVILVTRQIEVCAFDAQSDRPGLSDGCRVRVGRHVQVHCGESDGYRVILINHGSVRKQENVRGTIESI